MGGAVGGPDVETVEEQVEEAFEVGADEPVQEIVEEGLRTCVLTLCLGPQELATHWSALEFRQNKTVPVDTSRKPYTPTEDRAILEWARKSPSRVGGKACKIFYY